LRYISMTTIPGRPIRRSRLHSHRRLRDVAYEQLARVSAAIFGVQGSWMSGDGSI
jgi:hypothetical protein